jgi:uncharacterized protein
MKRTVFLGVVVVSVFLGGHFTGQSAGPIKGLQGSQGFNGSLGLQGLQGLQGLLVSPASAKAVYEEVIWDDLIPKKWFGEIKAQMGLLGRLGFLVDGSEEADAAMQRLRKKWDEAPIEPRFINKAIKIPGYVVALDANRKMISEFLLVPYFGACIHTPPPPANQIILVRLEKPINRIESMETVWVEGVLKDARVDTGVAVTGYALDARRVYPYTEK